MSDTNIIQNFFNRERDSHSLQVFFFMSFSLHSLIHAYPPILHAYHSSTTTCISSLRFALHCSSVLSCFFHLVLGSCLFCQQMFLLFSLLFVWVLDLVFYVVLVYVVALSLAHLRSRSSKDVFIDEIVSFYVSRKMLLSVLFANASFVLAPI